MQLQYDEPLSNLAFKFNLRRYIAGLCSCLFIIVYCLQICVKGPAARILRMVVGFNPYFNMLIGLFITIIVQSSSITTSTLTPVAAVGLIRLEAGAYTRSLFCST